MEELKEEELAKIEREIGKEAFNKGRFEEATKLFTNLVRNNEFMPFLTLPGYEIL
jgi:malate synthase